MDEASTRVLSNKLEPVSTLLEMSANTVVKLKINYTPEDLFPQLLAYLGRKYMQLNNSKFTDLQGVRNDETLRFLYFLHASLSNKIK